MPETYLHGIDVVEINDGVRSINTPATSVIFLVGTAPYSDPAIFPLNQPVMLLNAPRKAQSLVHGLVPAYPITVPVGTLYDAVKDIFKEAGAAVVVVRVEEGANIAATLANVAGSVVLNTGIYAALNCKALLGVTPKIIVAPGYTHQLTDGAPNQVVTAMKTVAGRLRATILVDGPNSTDVAAVDMADDIGLDRCLLIEPFSKYADDVGEIVTRPSSAMLAGVIARTDMTHGFWWSPSNQPINGIIGTARPISFGLSDPNTSANWLNERKVTTIVNEGGFRVWGQRGTGTDANWAFISVRRTADTIYDAIDQAMLWAMSRPMSANLFSDVVETVQAYLDYLKSKGAILGGKCWLDPELNTPTTLKAGKLWINFDIEPPSGLEHLTFYAYRNDGYYTETISRLAA